MDEFKTNLDAFSAGDVLWYSVIDPILKLDRIVIGVSIRENLLSASVKRGVKSTIESLTTSLIIYLKERLVRGNAEKSVNGANNLAILNAWSDVADVIAAKEGLLISRLYKKPPRSPSFPRD